MAPLIQQLSEDASIQSRICTTGQHQEMLAQVLDLFGIVSDYALSETKNMDLYQITAHILMGVREVLADFKPDIVLVHGDTATTMAASLGCYYARVPVAHVEAGLRTGNIYSPWPEEVNRKIVGAMAACHFTPTERSRQALLRENVAPETIHVTGNTVVDAILGVKKRLDNDSELVRELDNRIGIETDKHIVLVTGHRRESFGGGFERICTALQEIAMRDDVAIIYPVHLNPNVAGPVHAMLGDKENVHLLPPLEYLPFVRLMSRAKIILTDSGGIQEEAPSLGKPVLVMRDTTERPEAVEAGTVRLVGTDVNSIVTATSDLLDHEDTYLAMCEMQNPYGDGKASQRIVNILKRMYADLKGDGIAG